MNEIQKTLSRDDLEKIIHDQALEIRRLRTDLETFTAAAKGSLEGVRELRQRDASRIAELETATEELAEPLHIVRDPLPQDEYDAFVKANQIASIPWGKGCLVAAKIWVKYGAAPHELEYAVIPGVIYAGNLETAKRDLIPDLQVSLKRAVSAGDVTRSVPGLTADELQRIASDLTIFRYDRERFKAERLKVFKSKVWPRNRGKKQSEETIRSLFFRALDAIIERAETRRTIKP